MNFFAVSIRGQEDALLKSLSAALAETSKKPEPVLFSVKNWAVRVRLKLLPLAQVQPGGLSVESTKDAVSVRL